MKSERAERLVAWLLSLGIILCVLVIVPARFAGICLCNSPKEIVFELVAVASGAICAVAACEFGLALEDFLLAAFIAWSVISTALAPVDRWEAMRATGVSLAGVAAYWSSRTVTDRRSRRLLLDSATLAVGLVAAAVIVDAIGPGAFLSVGRPGGILGNRNFAAHFLSLGLPLLILQFVEARSKGREWASAFVITMLGAALLLTRSRAAWLAIAPSVALPLALFAIERGEDPRRAAGLRLIWPAAAMAFGIFIGLVIPTTLQWKASSPYLTSFETLTETESGSGQVRLDQYRDSIAMLRRHEVLGVGPGNWKIVYQPHSYSSRNADEEVSQPTVARQVWYVPSRPNSDWIGIAVERGVPAAIFIMATLLVLAVASARTIFVKKDVDEETRHESIAALSLIVTLLFLGAVDVVLQLAPSSYLFFMLLAIMTPRERPLFTLSLPIVPRVALALAAILFGLLLTTLNLNEAYASYLIARSDSGDAQRIAFDQSWLISEIVWNARAVRTNPGPFPACD